MTYREVTIDPSISELFSEKLGNRTLTQRINKSIDWEKGSFSAILPVSVEVQDIVDFDFGFTRTQLNSEYVSAEPTSPNIILDSYIDEFLAANSNGVFLVEDMLSSKDNGGTTLNKEVTTFFGNEVYYYLNSRNKVNHTLEDVLRFVELWFFVGLLTSADLLDIDLLSGELSLPVVDSLIQNVKVIVLGVFDGDSYLIWEKTHD